MLLANPAPPATGVSQVEPFPLDDEQIVVGWRTNHQVTAVMVCGVAAVAWPRPLAPRYEPQDVVVPGVFGRVDATPQS